MKINQITSIIVFCCLVCSTLLAQNDIVSARIESISAKTNQTGASPMLINLSEPPPKLKYNQNSLVFNFVNSQNPDNQSFSFKLDGLDYEWLTCNNCSQALYAHLDGGDYTFLVKTNQPEAIAAKFSFSIEGNIWHKWWFVPMLLLYAIVILSAVIYLFVMFQFRQKLADEQRVHKEKIASMVELTAGIAHEIQNPLNFVNNFSELSIDLATELDEEIDKEPMDKPYIKELMTDLTTNQEKINHHGKRASSIVKNMLEHSRHNSGKKERIDINALVDESLRLSYHGLRAKDKTFNATIETHFETPLSKIEVMPQDLGRVLLNLFNNAFYAVNERNHLVIAKNEAASSYTPSVFVSTKQFDNQILIKIKDNGIGMPEKVRAKVFQPFFTTKPTGEGTGLGLSLAYDIVTKGHGGTLEVESTEGVGSEFIIKLPI